MQEKHLIVLIGPTGVGKTTTSIALAKHFNAPIVSADSRQFYKEMSIGTAAPTADELSLATHHLVAHKSVVDRYSCGMFEIEALKVLSDIYLTQNVAILTGGSMLYIDAVIKGIDDFPTPNPELRKSLLKQLENDGIESLRAQLKLLDPISYEQVDLKNPQRILKALEVSLQTGKPYSSFLTQPQKKRPFIPIKVGLNLPREELYQRINQRVDKMVELGLVEEARQLYPLRGYTALKTVGYRELFEHFDGHITLEKAIELIKRNSRRYAKRQLTWWARDNEIEWFSPFEPDKVIEYIVSLVKRNL